MAIEFNCPYCTSTIRVKDNAAGKRGKCPRCEQQLLVPTIELPQAPAESLSVPDVPQPSDSHADKLPTDVGPELSVAAQASGMNVDGPIVVAPTPSGTAKYTRRNRGRRRNASAPIVLGILAVCFAVIIGLAGYIWWKNQPLVLEGRLVGDRVPSTTLRPATISADDVSEQAKQSTLAGLRELPYSLQSNIVVTEFRGNSSGTVEVRLVPTTTTSIIRVDPSSDATLTKWLGQVRERLVAKRTSDVSEASKRFYEAYAEHTSTGASMGDAGYFRNQLALGVMNPGLGYFVEAVAGRQACPCVFEDSAGSLYFAVPSGTEQFTIRGRALADGKKLFTGTYTVDCSAAPETIEVVKPDATPKSKEDSGPVPAASDSDKSETEPTDTKAGASASEPSKMMDGGGVFEPEDQKEMQQ